MNQMGSGFDVRTQEAGYRVESLAVIDSIRGGTMIFR